MYTKKEKKKRTTIEFCFGDDDPEFNEHVVREKLYIGFARGIIAEAKSNMPSTTIDTSQFDSIPDSIEAFRKGPNPRSIPPS